MKLTPGITLKSIIVASIFGWKS